MAKIGRSTSTSLDHAYGSSASAPSVNADWSCLNTHARASVAHHGSGGVAACRTQLLSYSRAEPGFTAVIFTLVLSDLARVSHIFLSSGRARSARPPGRPGPSRIPLGGLAQPAHPGRPSRILLTAGCWLPGRGALRSSDRLQIAQIYGTAEICKTGIQQPLTAAYDHGAKSHRNRRVILWHAAESSFSLNASL